MKRLAGLCVLLAGCATPAPSSSSLPAVPAYSEAFQAELFGLLEQVPAGSALDVFVTDAIELRCAVQGARGDPVASICADR